MAWTIACTIVSTLLLVAIAMNFKTPEKSLDRKIEHRYAVSDPQFRREMGKYVDEATIAGYEQHVFVPVVPDESDAATLRQIPGIDAAEADALVAGRPYASREAFLRAAAPVSAAAFPPGTPPSPDQAKAKADAAAVEAAFAAQVAAETAATRSCLSRIE